MTGYPLVISEVISQLFIPRDASYNLFFADSDSKLNLIGFRAASTTR
jgi:hypothetical protein